MVRMVRLHNGAEETEEVVQQGILALNALSKEKAGLFVTFASVVCEEDPKGENRDVLTKWTSGQEDLKRRGVMEADGTVSDSFKNIIKAAVAFYRNASGELLGIKIRNPINCYCRPVERPTATPLTGKPDGDGCCVNASQPG